MRGNGRSRKGSEGWSDVMGSERDDETRGIELIGAQRRGNIGG